MLRPSSQPRRLRTSIYAGAFSSPAPEERGWLLTDGGEIPYTDGYCHSLPAVAHKMDPGILAQQSDVRCKRGRLGVIMMAPVAYLPHRGASEQLIEPTAFATGALYYWKPNNLFHQDGREGGAPINTGTQLCR